MGNSQGPGLWSPYCQHLHANNRVAEIFLKKRTGYGPAKCGCVSGSAAPSAVWAWEGAPTCKVSFPACGNARPCWYVLTSGRQAWSAAARTNTIYQFRLRDVQPLHHEAKARWQAEAVGSPTCCLAWRPPTIQAPASKMRNVHISQQIQYFST